METFNSGQAAPSVIVPQTGGGSQKTKPSFSEYPQRILIVEDDYAQHNLLAEPLKETFPYLNCKFVESGSQAWDKLQKQAFDFIVLDWKLPDKLSGLALVNRLRMDPYYRHIPILVLSGYLTAEDCALLEEFSFTGMLLKPYRSILLVRKIKDLFDEAKWFYAQHERLESLLEQGLVKPNLLKEGIQNLVSDCPRQLPLLLLTARVLRENGLFDEAENMVSQARQVAPDSLMAEAELGKILLRQNRQKEAFQILDKARQRSPKNLERLCDLGSLHLQRLELEAAQSAFAQAGCIDVENPTVLGGQQLTKNIGEYFRNASPLSIPDSFAALLNAIGISYVRNGEIEKGLAHYLTAFDYLFDRTDKAKVAFNLALGYLRGVKPQNATVWLKQSINLYPEFEKAKVYLRKLESQVVFRSPFQGQGVSADVGLPASKQTAFIDAQPSLDDEAVLAMDEGI